MEPRHEDDAAVVRLIDLHLSVRVLVAVDLCPRAPPVARSPRSSLAAGSLRRPNPRVCGCLGMPGIDEENEARAAILLHTGSRWHLGPVPSPVHALNNQALLVPGHDQMIWIVVIDDG